MSEGDELKRLRLAVQFMRNDISALMQRGTDLEVELAMKQAEIDRLTAAAAKPASKAKK